jgi:hypothetical protein
LFNDARYLPNVVPDKKIMRYNQTTLKKLEDLFRELEYAVRYEKGNFQSGYCKVEERKIVVINKFFDTEARINCLLEILGGLSYNPDTLSPASLDLIEKWKKRQAEASENTEVTSETQQPNSPTA